MITLYLGRHGETRLNSEERLRSWIDEPLNKDGVKEAEAMGVAMAKTEMDRIYCSDLDRADHTARIVAQHHGLKPMARSWFRPLNYGDLSGKLVADIQPDLDRLNKEWQTDPTVKAPNGESFSEFQDRNLAGLHAILKVAIDGEEIMLVAHLRNCLLFHAVAKKGGPLEGEDILAMAGKEWHQESGSVSKFTWDGNALKFNGMAFEQAKPEAESMEAS